MLSELVKVEKKVIILQYSKNGVCRVHIFIRQVDIRPTSKAVVFFSLFVINRDFSEAATRGVL